mmetsp:Transcript_27719/g.43270  ORF Transcript_27719/g.43270 Transcript_27719/m.43270 type:complete len:274 (+) Transcript_27719:156-977(+)
MAEQLIRPVGAQRSSESWTFGVSVMMLSLALVGLVAALHSSGPSMLAQTSGILSPIQSADSAETKVANYMAMVATKELEQKPLARRDTPTLDWNWAPELHRDKQVPGWVGSRWVAPMEGAKGIHLMHRPEHASATGGGSGGLAGQGSGGSNLVGKSPKMLMPSMHPLRFFPQDGLPTWDTGDVVKSAEKSVRFVHQRGSEQRKELISSAPNLPISQFQGTLTQVRQGSLAAKPYKISAEKAGTPKALLEAKVNNLQKALAEVEGELEVKEARH